MHHKKGTLFAFGQFENLPVTYVGIYVFCILIFYFYLRFFFSAGPAGLLFMTNLEATGGGDLSNAVKVPLRT